MEDTKKQTTYRGKTVDELKALDVREFSKYLNSRPRRFVLRRFQDIEKFVKRANEKISKNKQIKTHKRDIVIVPAMIGMKIQIYNGKTFVPIVVTEEMLGHKFGEFAPTRARIKHGKAGVFDSDVTDQLHQGATKGTKAKSKK